jgi:hypothetical protein
MFKRDGRGAKIERKISNPKGTIKEAGRFGYDLALALS